MQQMTYLLTHAFLFIVATLILGFVTAIESPKSTKKMVSFIWFVVGLTLFTQIYFLCLQSPA